ncbi:hypothetical protein CL628_04210 [bacterium]|nr:hypothetical protein [bacterium]
MTQEILLLIVGIAGGAGVVWWLARRQGGGGDQAALLAELQRQVTDRLDKVTEQVDARLREGVKATNESKSFLADRVSSTERTVREVTTQLSKLQATTSDLKDTTSEINSFQQLLKNPKVRGSFGEVLLYNLLGEVLPADRYATQYTLPSSTEIADAVIKLQDDYIVAIDAKFPLPAYETYANEVDKEKKKALRSAVVRDIKKHITDISKKYISPQDNTLDYAFMYIPVEGVYYETMVRSSGKEAGLWDYCLEHKVVPVSPNSFVAYLQTVLVGLRGMKIEQQAKQILQHLSQVRKDFHRFNDDFTVVGKHLMNAKNKFDESTRRLDKFEGRLGQIEDGNVPLTTGAVAEVQEASEEAEVVPEQS